MKSPFRLASLIVPIALVGCDRIAAPIVPGADSAVGIDGSANAPGREIVSDFQTALRGTWSWGLDSVQVTLRCGDSVRTVSGPLSAPLRIASLPSGRWTAEVSVYPSRTRADGAVAPGYWALDTVEVSASAATTLDPSLVPADLRLSDLTPDKLRPDGPSRPSSLAGVWHVRGWTGSDSLPDGASLTLYRSGLLIGFDGRDSFPATWGVDGDGTFSIQHVWEHPWPELDPPISFGAAEPLAALRGMRLRATADSLVLGIAGDTVQAILTRTGGPLDQEILPRIEDLPPPVVAFPDSSLDTASPSLLPVALSAIATNDSFAILTIATRHPAALPRLAMIGHMEFHQTGGCVQTGDPDTLWRPDGTTRVIHPTLCSDGISFTSQRILVAAAIPPGSIAIQTRTPVLRRIAVPLASLDDAVEFHDHSGTTFELPR